MFAASAAAQTDRENQAPPAASLKSEGNQIIRVQKQGTQETLRYLFYSPVKAESEAGESFPLVLFLHGGGEGGDDIEKVKKHGLPKLIAAGKNFPFFVVSPQNPSETQFWDDQQLMRLVDEMIRKHPIDESRIYVTGLSRGAYGAWRLAIQNADRFAALVPISGGGPLPYVKKLKSVPTWAFHGAKDKVIPVSESQRLVDALQKAGGNVKLTVYPDARHDAWTQTYENPKLYQWLLKQKRQRPVRRVD
jgi:predicted peptidase